MVTGTRVVLGEIGRPDCFMRLLRILGLAAVLARLVGQVTRVIAIRDRPALRPALL